MNLILAILTGLSLALTLWRWLAARGYRFESVTGVPAGVEKAKSTLEATSRPSVTILKPVKGVEADTRKCLRSWLAQVYSGHVQIVFGVADAADPACAVIQSLLTEFPKVDAGLVVCPNLLALNRKVSTLIQLEPHVCHDFVVISDADVCVPADFLERSIPLFDTPEVGLVHSFYRLANPSTLPMQWEAVGVNADFWSEVLQARSLKDLDFALGATMILPRHILGQIGGFSPLASFLADDYQLGRQVAQLGGKIVFSPVVVDCWETSQSWTQVWSHQVRWARTIRVCQPMPYFFSILNNSSLWPMLLLAWPGCLSLPGATFLAVFCLSFRVVSALDIQYRLTGSRSALYYWWMVPIKDLLHTLVWAGAFLGSHITWRGDRFRVLPGGKLVKVGK